MAITAMALVLESWINYPHSEWNIVASAAVSAFSCALLTPLQMTGGLILGVVAVFVLCVVVEKDPSGLGPFEVILPFQLVFAAIPILTAAWAGRSLRAWLSNAV